MRVLQPHCLEHGNDLLRRDAAVEHFEDHRGGNLALAVSLDGPDDQGGQGDCSNQKAAAQKLRTVNSEVRVEGIVADVNPTNVAQLCDGIDAIVDGMDNFETRFLVNDLAVRQRIPWVYGGCLGAEGQTMTILPGGRAIISGTSDVPTARTLYAKYIGH